MTYVYTGRKRELTKRFVALRSHYLFESRFCNVASGNEKGHVENSVKRSERTYLFNMPPSKSFCEPISIALRSIAKIGSSPLMTESSQAIGRSN